MVPLMKVLFFLLASPGALAKKFLSLRSVGHVDSAIAKKAFGSYASSPNLGASCGVVMMAWGEGYNEIGMQAATRIRSLPAAKGWCPMDEQLDHIPVTLFTDFTKNSNSLVDIRPEKDLAPWISMGAGNTSLKSGLGSWKFRWYHAQSILSSPYHVTLYLDVDAVPCSAQGIANILWKLVDNNATIATTLTNVKDPHHGCEMSSGNCSYPTPSNLLAKELGEWSQYTERNAGVVAIDTTTGRPLIEEWARQIRSHVGEVKGDQYAFREACFAYRHAVRQLVYSDQDVCRYNKSAECSTEQVPGCSIHHMFKMRSLKMHNITF